MDKWKELELKKMSIGGNSIFHKFLQSRSDYNSKMSFQEKYNSKAAALYRDKINTEAEGRVWIEKNSSANSYIPPKSSNDMLSNRSINNSHSSHSNQKSNFSSPQELEAWLDTSEAKNNKDDYFKSLVEENSRRKDDLPPSQGGKFVGFGSNPANFDNDDGSLKIFKSGISYMGRFASAALKKTTEIASVAGQKTYEISQNVTDRVKDGSLYESVSCNISNVANKVTDVGSKSLRNVGSYIYGSGENNKYLAYNQNDKMPSTMTSFNDESRSQQSSYLNRNSSERRSGAKYQSLETSQNDGWDSWGDEETEVSNVTSKSRKNKGGSKDD